MVIGDGVAGQQVPPPQFAGASIDNIMSGIENTGTVKMNNHRKKLRQRFDIIKKLGQGTYGKVQLGINKETGQEVAIKTIKKSKIETEADLIRIRREVQIMSSVQHPNIIHIYEVFENREKMVLVMEFAAGGELYDYLSERKVLSEEEARRIFRQVSTAIYYCHKHKICHRDLKLENILLDENGNAKIADFGLSNVFDEQRLLATFCGSPLYASPEIVKGTPYLGPEVDCWSLGVLLYTLVYGAMPFDGANFKRLVKQISMGDYFEPKKPSRASPLIREMLTVCPKRRANIESICNHWWVNESYNESCLTLAEELANQTPVRLDVLLSLAPPSVTADQLVVNPLEEQNASSVQRSHSMGSVMEIPADTEAERRIIDMVQKGGETALMPSPTRTITPSESPAQVKRKLEPTPSAEITTGAARKKDKQAEVPPPLPPPLEEMEVSKPAEVTSKDLEKIQNMCDELLAEKPKSAPEPAPVASKKETPKEIPAAKDKEKPVIKKVFNKGKTIDLAGSIKKVEAESKMEAPKPERKNSLPEDNLKPERRKSRILETAEKFQSMNNQNNEKYKKFVIPGVSVGSFKKEFERKASITTPSSATIGPLERKQRNSESTSSRQNSQEDPVKTESSPTEELPVPEIPKETVKESDSKSSVGSFSLEDARRSMENSIALLNQAKSDSGREVRPTEDVGQPGGEDTNERGGRKPPMPFGANGRTPSGNLATGFSRPVKIADSPPTSTPTYAPEQPLFPSSPKAENENEGTTKTSRAEITLKSATLPRRKPAKTEILVDLQTKQNEPVSTMRFSTEMQHQVPDMRTPPTPGATVTLQSRSNSGDSQQKEHTVTIQKPPSFTRTSSARTGSLSRQSTNESNDSDTTISQTLNTSASTVSQQPIKKSPREFIIPITVEGGGIVTPRATSIEPSDTTNNSSSSFASGSRMMKPRKISSLLGDDDDFPTLKRHTSLGRESDSEEPRFHTMHRLRSSKPSQRGVQEPNDSGSSGDEDDEDNFELLTAENLFSTLLSRVKALTQRVNANNNFSSNFPSSRLFDEMRQARSPFWNHEPFGRLKITNCTNHKHINPANNKHHKIPSQISYTITTETVETKKKTRINNGSNPWRSTLSRDLHSDFDSMFSRSGATLPRGTKTRKSKSKTENSNPTSSSAPNDANNNPQQIPEPENPDENLDLRDLDLSQLRLSKKDLETLSSLTPSLSKKVQDQLLAQLPPTQAKKLSRTLSLLQNSDPGVKVFRRSQSTARDVSSKTEPVLDRSVRASSVARDIISPPLDYKSFKFPYHSEVRGKYSPYSSESSSYDYGSRGTTEYEKSVSPSSRISPPKEHGRPPSGCFSPPPLTPLSSDSSSRRRSSRRISRFLRPDFFDTPREESAYVREKKEREAETQRVLKEIRERSRDRSCSEAREHQIKVEKEPEKKVNFSNDKEHLRHLLNTVDSNIENLENQIRRQRSMSRDVFETGQYNPIKLTDRILDDLHNITLLHKQSSREGSLAKDSEEGVAKTKSDRNLEREKSVPRERSKEKSVPRETPLPKEKSLPKEEKAKTEEKEAPKAKKVSKLVRPKSYPSKEPGLKIYKQKSSDGILDNEVPGDSQELKITEKEDSDIPSKPVSEKPLKPTTTTKVTPPKEGTGTKKVVKKKTPTKKETDSSEGEPRPVKKLVKKKVEKPEEPKPDLLIVPTLEQLKEKSPDKKANKGFLTAIQQKFEKFRENTKASRESKKLGTATVVVEEKPKSPEREVLVTSPDSSLDEARKAECKSKIDTMIRSLRERSVSRENNLTESCLIKRAVSVEDMPESGNKAGVNRVLGLFKKFEKEKGPQSVKSTSYLLAMSQGKEPKERPKSLAFGAKTTQETPVQIKYTCPDCEEEKSQKREVQKREKPAVTPVEEKERLRNNRKGLMLDLKENGHSRTLSNISYPPPHPSELAETPSYENIANFGTESRCSSSHNFLSPTQDDPDLCFDDWSSVCSDDHIMMSSSPSLSRLSRFSHHFSPTSGGGTADPNNENVLDRIRRRSFFPRFNEKKNRRVSTIVGPAARDYYQSTPRSSSKTRVPEYNRSQTTSLLPDSSYVASKYASDLNANPARPRHYPRTPTAYDTSSSGTSSSLYTSVAKRRPSYTNGSISTVSNVIDSYASLRKPRPYEHRTVSLLDSGLSRRETEMGLERDDVLRSSLRTKTSSIPRSPTNNVNV